MSSKKRDLMSRKRPTQVELERQNSELRKQVQQLQKRLRQAIKNAREDRDIQEDLEYIADMESTAIFQETIEKEKQKEKQEDDEFLTFELPNGKTKRIRKRIMTAKN